jgi:alpha/beta superfamily hydrolase
MVQAAPRTLTFSSGDLSLEGALHVSKGEAPVPGVVVCHPHPQYGGDMHNNVVIAACEALSAQGYAALRFNFRGVGDSEGEHDRGKGEIDDVRAALAHLVSLDEVDAERIGLIGYSFGAIVSAEAASGALRGLALISPPLAFADLRVQWGCPAIVLGGADDDLAPPDRLRVASEAPDVELRIVDGVDHSWWGSEDELAEALGDFFNRRFQ